MRTASPRSSIPRAFASVALAAALASACSSSSNDAGSPSAATPPAASCVPGAQSACSCTDGSRGAQVCAASGDHYEPCQCESGAGGQSNGGKSGSGGSVGSAGFPGSAGTSQGGSGGTSPGGGGGVGGGASGGAATGGAGTSGGASGAAGMVDVGGAAGSSAAGTSGAGGGPIPGGCGMPTSLDLHDAMVFDNPPNEADWPVTTTITEVDFQYMGMDGVHVAFDKQDGPNRWPDVTPPGWDGPLQYTLGLVECVGGQWVASAAIQFWYGLAASGGNVALDNQIAKNWYYDGRWGPLAGYQPATGELVGVFVVAGNVRGVKDGSQSPVMERSNVVLVPFPDVNGASYTFP